MRSTLNLHLLAAFGVTLLSSLPAAAHISLMQPAARYDGSVGNQSKACPCGVGLSNRLCEVVDDRSDPDRSTNVTTLTAGSTLVIQFDEYINHGGRYRVAFDPDGADLDDFNANILTDIVDPVAPGGNAGGTLWEIAVTVPNTPCDNCTIQLIQMMNGDTSAPVLDPVGLSTYYQCADVVIVAAGEDVGVDPPPDMGTDAGVVPVPDMGSVSTYLGSPPTADMRPNVNPDTGGLTDSGREFPNDVHGTGGCAVVGGGTAGGWAIAALVVLGGLRRRRRTSRRQAR